MIAKPSKGPVTFEEFKSMLVDILQVDEEKVVPDASFVSDLMVDSIKLVELMLGLEENGINIPIEAAWDVQTVGDAYRVYTESLKGGDQQLATSG
jgi:acyl carrier protein